MFQTYDELSGDRHGEGFEVQLMTSALGWEGGAGDDSKDSRHAATLGVWPLGAEQDGHAAGLGLSSGGGQ